MADVFSKKKRSQVMSRIRSEGNEATELALARLFRSCGISGWRRHFPLTGKPDFVFPGMRLAVFVDGCFWHGCRYHSHIPKSNKKYWAAKLARNKIRDKKVNKFHRANGWTVIRIWEHQIERDMDTVLHNLELVLTTTRRT